jgi:hypothetical protein
MAEYPYTKEDLQDQFGWSFQQIKTRLRYLDILLSDHYQGKKGVQYRFDNRALAIFRRLHELEGKDYDIKVACRQIILENEKNGSNGQAEDTKEYEGNLKVEVKYLKRENENLKDQVRYLRNQVEEKDRRIQQLLPGDVDGNGKDDEFKELSLLQVVKKWFTTKT